MAIKIIQSPFDNQDIKRIACYQMMIEIGLITLRHPIELNGD
jgi:hypothetical protein